MKIPLDVFTNGLGRRVFYLNGLYLGEVQKVPFTDYYTFHCLGIHNDRRYYVQEEASEALVAEAQLWWDGIPGNSPLEKARANLQYNESEVKAGIDKAEQMEELGVKFKKLVAAAKKPRSLSLADVDNINWSIEEFRQYMEEALGIPPHILRNPFKI